MSRSGSTAEEPEGTPVGTATTSTVTSDPMVGVMEALRRRRLVLGDGSRGGAVVARMISSAFLVGVALVLVWQWLPGPEDSIVGADGTITYPRLTIVAALAAVAMTFAALGWHVSGSRHLRPMAAVAGVAVTDFLFGAIIFDYRGSLETAAAMAPSFAAEAADNADRWTVLGLAAFAGTACFVATAVVARRWARIVTTLAAATAPFAVLIGLLSSGSAAHPRLEGFEPGTADVPVAVTVAPASTATHMGQTMLQLTGLIAIACFGLLAVLDVRELISRRASSDTALANMSHLRTRRTTSVAGAVVVALVLLGAHGHLPGPDDLLPVFEKRINESWLHAIVFAVAGLAVVRNSERHRFASRGLLVPVVASGLALFSGSVILALSRVVQLLVSPFTDSATVLGFVGETLPSWSLWAQDWSNIAVPMGAGLASLALVLRGERSDRLVFLTGLAVISAVPGLLYVLERHDVTWLDRFSPATPDQVMVVAAVLVAIAAASGSEVIQARRGIRLVVGVVVVMVVGALVSDAVGSRAFHLGLVVPLMLDALLGGQRFRGRPARGVHRLAVLSLLLLITTGGLISDFLDETKIGTGNLFAFLFLSAPLLLAELIERDAVEEREEAMLPDRRAPRWLLAPLALVATFLAIIAVQRSDDVNTGRVYTIDVDLQPGWSGQQVGDTGALESVTVTNVSEPSVGIIAVAREPGGGFECTLQLLGQFGFVLDGELASIDDVGGIPAAAGRLDDGSEVVCASSRDDVVERFLLASFDSDEHDEVFDQLDHISFGTD